MLASPFADTLFLDSDTFPCETIATLFRMLDVQPGAPDHEDLVYDVGGVLDYVDVLMAHEFHTLHGFLGDEAMGMPDAFGLLNAGVVIYRRRDRVTKFLHHWLALYLRDIERKVGDATVDRSVTRNFQRQPAMQWALYHATAKDGLRVHPLSPIWNARSWNPVLTGLRKRDPRNTHDCCRTPTDAHVLIDHHCNLTLAASECASSKKAKLDVRGVTGVDAATLDAARHARPRFGCP